MFKEEIILKLLNHHESFVQYISGLSGEDFMYARPGKWSSGQQADHISRSLQPLSRVMGFPKTIMRLVFGKSNRPSKDYETLIEKYKTKLAAGGRASGRFVPGPVPLDQRNRLNEKIMRTANAIGRKINRFSEDQLDHYILPHPLLGRVTLREMLYFTIYHVQHHKKLIEESRSMV